MGACLSNGTVAPASGQADRIVAQRTSSVGSDQPGGAPRQQHIGAAAEANRFGNLDIVERHSEQDLQSRNQSELLKLEEEVKQRTKDLELREQALAVQTQNVQKVLDDRGMQRELLDQRLKEIALLESKLNECIQTSLEERIKRNQHLESREQELAMLESEMNDTIQKSQEARKTKTKDWERREQELVQREVDSLEREREVKKQLEHVLRREEQLRSRLEEVEAREAELQSRLSDVEVREAGSKYDKNLEKELDFRDMDDDSTSTTAASSMPPIWGDVDKFADRRADKLRRRSCPEYTYNAALLQSKQVQHFAGTTIASEQAAMSETDGPFSVKVVQQQAIESDLPSFPYQSNRPEIGREMKKLEDLFQLFGSDSL